VSAAPPTAVDVAIVGGGLVGASLALALAPTRCRVALIEAVPPGDAHQPSFDERTTALSNGSCQILKALGAWPAMAAAASPIREIHVSDAGGFGVARLSAAKQGLEALGFVVPNRVIGAALWERLRALPQVAIHSPASIASVELGEAQVRLRLGGGASASLAARLAVGADGAASSLREIAGISAEVADYQQVAIVAAVGTDRPAAGVAYERFTATGPLAVLPLADGHYTVVWTAKPERASELMACDDARYLDELQSCFGWRVGRLLRVGRRSAYPLALSRASALVGRRCVLVGNAAQALHPVAGQGFNLGLRDAATLAECVAGAADPGDPALLAQYAAARLADRRGMIGFTDGLVRLFASQQPGVGALRRLGLALFDLSPPAKRAMSRLSWGFSSRASRLMRGLPLA
jgi:2-octaprenyl-6-methoxyphenol hydroxylase